jgi:ribose transport system permease protein
MYTDGYPISGMPDWFAWFGRGTLFGIQVPILIMLVTYFFAWVLLQHTRIGRYVYAIGGNEEAVRLSGVRASRFKLLVYSISGLTAAIAGLVLSSRSGRIEQWFEHARRLALCAERDQGRNHPAGDFHQPAAA